MTSRGRQHPDGPLEPPPGWITDGGLRGQALEAFALPEFPEGAGGFLANMLGGQPPEEGPPWVHTIAPPQQPVFSRSGKLVYRPPSHPTYTLTEGVR